MEKSGAYISYKNYAISPAQSSESSAVGIYAPMEEKNTRIYKLF